MKKFLINFILFLLPFIIIHIVLSNFLNPYSGNTLYETKIKHVRQNKSKYNTLIFGSSRMYRHIDTKLMDSIMTDYSFSSFNLGTPGTFNPEVYFLYKNFLNSSYSSQYQYTFIELTPLIPATHINMTSDRGTYWLNLDNLNFSLRYILHSKIGKNKLKEIFYYILTYLYKIGNLSKYKSFFRINSNSEYKHIINNQGYYSLNRSMKHNSKPKNSYKQRLENFLRDTTKLQKRINISKQVKIPHKKYFNAVHLKRLKGFIKESEQKGIHIFFVIPPRLTDYKEIRAIQNFLPKKNIIDLSNAKKYPKLYKVEYSFDIGHLNDKGANLFTKYLVDEVKIRLKDVK